MIDLTNKQLLDALKRYFKYSDLRFNSDCMVTIERAKEARSLAISNIEYLTGTPLHLVLEQVKKGVGA